MERTELRVHRGLPVGVFLLFYDLQMGKLRQGEDVSAVAHIQNSERKGEGRGVRSWNQRQHPPVAKVILPLSEGHLPGVLPCT